MVFYFDSVKGKKVLKSDYLDEITAFFTTRDDFDFSVVGTMRVVSPVQTHTNHVVIVDERDVYLDTDGLVTDCPNNLIYLRFADCTPLILYDRRQKVVAVSHAGWRGTVNKIGVETVKKMNSNPKDVIAVIGPAISICCYEVSEDVKAQLLSTVRNTDKLYNNRNVDLKLINAEQLREVGISKIDICPYCTSCHNNFFYSYRKENGTPNRHFAVASLNYSIV